MIYLTKEFWFYVNPPAKAIAELDRGLVLPRYDKLVQLEVENHGNREGLLKLLHAAPFLKFLEIHVVSQHSTIYWMDVYMYTIFVPYTLGHFLCFLPGLLGS